LGRTRTGFLGSRGPSAQAGPVAGAAIRGRWWASASSPAPAPGRRPRTKDPSTAVPELCCQNLTAPSRRTATRGRWWASAPSSTSAPGLHCQNLTVPWPTEDQGPVHGGAGALLSKFDSPPRRPATLGQSGQWLSNPGAWEVRRSCRPEGDRGGGNNPGLLLPDVLPGPRRHPRRVRAAGGCQPLVLPG